MATIEIHKPNELDRSKWREMQDIAFDAYANTFRAFARPPSKSKEEIAYFLHADQPGLFYDSQIDPSIRNGNRFDANQSFSRLCVALAYTGHYLVGWGYSADRVKGSGPPEEPVNNALGAKTLRAAKGLFIPKDLTIREIVVSPTYKKNGIAKQIGRELLERATEVQPVLIETWPDILPQYVTQYLTKLGFVPTADRDVEIFGPGCINGLTRQVTMRAPSVVSVYDKL